MTKQNMTKTDRSRRRLFLGLGVMTASYFGLRYGIPRVSEVFAADFEFEPVSDPMGFRRIEGGTSTVGFDPYFGISAADAAQNEEIESGVRARLCDTLFGVDNVPEGTVPVAYFSDYNCPFCRVLSEMLARLATELPSRIRVAWHELPLLGESSVLAARGALAAKRQGAYVEFQRTLTRSRFMATSGYLTTLAGDLGIDAEKLIRDMASEDVSIEIAESRALARIFGFVGTPAMIVGRTVVQGEISQTQLQRLIDRESADGPIEACV